LYRYAPRTASTALQVAVDHAFTGTYVDCLHPNDPPEARRCPCSQPLRSPQHITHQCYRFHRERAAAGINYYYYGRKIFGPSKKNTMHLLTFIQESRAFTRPAPSSMMNQACGDSDYYDHDDCEPTTT
jgi:hypothetical protein